MLLRHRMLLLVALSTPALPGCVKHLAMEGVEGVDPAQPHTVVLYSGVREGAQRYADYSQIDASILKPGE